MLRLEVNDSETEVDLDKPLAEIISVVGERNFEPYDGTGRRSTEFA